MLLFFDTETTGKADFKRPHTDPCQPSLVQLALQLFADNGTRPLHTLAVIVNPGVPIPEDASDNHGITTEIATARGVKPQWAMKAFIAFAENATLVGHNIAFDLLVVNKTQADLGLSPLKNPTFCTMEAMTPVCKIPGNYGKYKWPRLSEAYKHATGLELKNAHDALVDIQATKCVYDHLTTLNLTPTAGGKNVNP